MKNVFVLLFLILYNVLIVVPEERYIIEEVNDFGGMTIVHVFNVYERENTNYSKLIEFYDSGSIIVKRTFELTGEITNKTGIEIQTNYFRNNSIEKYEMLFSDTHYNIHGFNRLIEEVNSEGNIISRTWYNNDTILDISQSADDRFENYNIEFLESEYFADYKPNEDGDTITASAKYFRIRSVVNFDSKLVELDSKDIELMDTFSGIFGLDKFSQLYSKKVRVYSGDKAYWLYVQTQLERVIPQQKATVRYYPIGKNRELYLICIGFYDINNQR